MSGQRQKLTALGLWILVFILIPGTVLAQSSSSTNYKVDQTFFGTGGELDAASASYRAKQTAGELAIGMTASTSYSAFAGFNTTDDPFLEFVVIGNNIDLGYLETTSTKTANGVFSVRAWQAHGYVVQTQSNPPTNTSTGAQQLAAPSTPTASAVGTEQFGINLVANTSPTTFGANPAQQPDSTFSFGEVATGYDTPNLYKYVKGDVIAHSDKSTSITQYTISYIFNINEVTPSGQYRFPHILVATGTY